MLSWVLGAGGLLGRALTRTLEALPGRHYAPAEPLAWDDAARLHAQLGQAAQQFCALAAAQPAGGLACVYWAAGIGTMDGAAAALALETEALAALVQALARCGAGLGAGSLRLCLASSAGALHAGAGAALVTEHTPATPTTPYAHEKLRQEALLHAAAAGAAHLAPRVCRISTLYGSAAAPGRDKGLIQHAASALAQRRPLHVFVPLDTLRDYIAAPGRIAAPGLRSAPPAAPRAQPQPGGQRHVKLDLAHPGAAAPPVRAPAAGGQRRALARRALQPLRALCAQRLAGAGLRRAAAHPGRGAGRGAARAPGRALSLGRSRVGRVGKQLLQGARREDARRPVEQLVVAGALQAHLHPRRHAAEAQLHL